MRLSGAIYLSCTKNENVKILASGSWWFRPGVSVGKNLRASWRKFPSPRESQNSDRREVRAGIWSRSVFCQENGLIVNLVSKLSTVLGTTMKNAPRKLRKQITFAGATSQTIRKTWHQNPLSRSLLGLCSVSTGYLIGGQRRLSGIDYQAFRFCEIGAFLRVSKTDFLTKP